MLLIMNNQNTRTEFIETSSVFLVTLLYRVIAVILVILTLTIRPTLPPWMLEWFGRISYPLLVYSIVPLIFHRQTAAFLRRFHHVLYFDLAVSLGIIMIGGSWRSSYFGYTITTIILFTIIKGRIGAYIATAVLTIGAIVKDPSGGMSSLAVFFVDDWDMRMGAALIYITAGLILGYFSELLKRFEAMSRAKIEETRKLAAVAERDRMVLELHDGAKQMVNAMLLKMNPLIKKTNNLPAELASELSWLWRGMYYLQSELEQVMDALKGISQGKRSACDIVSVAKEEAKIAGALTGFFWKVIADAQEAGIPRNGKLPLRKLLSEALMNSWKHSGVDEGIIELVSTGDSVVITITDSGRGFDHSQIENSKTLGLKSLRHRAEEMNGTLAIETAPGKGCRLMLTIPKNK